MLDFSYLLELILDLGRQAKSHSHTKMIPQRYRWPLPAEYGYHWARRPRQLAVHFTVPRHRVRRHARQYLFGVVDTAGADEAGLPRYTQIWAFDRPGEKRAFEELIDFITERRARHPGLHVCHCNHYEPTSADHLTELHGTRQEAVGALTGRFAAREDEVDGLFRLGVFTDLYRVVRQGVRAGVESYSIKRLEPLCGYGRRVDLAEATASLIVLEAALEDGTAAGDGERRRVVAGYNEDDCRATLALRDWLEARRAELAERLGKELPRPVSVEKPGAAGAPGTARIRSALLAGVSAETSGAIAWGVSAETREGRARALLADLLDWHRREDKPAWWRYFYLRTLSPAELTGEPDALGGLTGGDMVGQVKKSVVRRFRFPPLAVAGAARNLVLLGDPQQLAQPSHATHPPGAGASALEHILGDRATMPAAAGLLLDQTWRMHPDLCRYTSAAFYDGKLHGVDGLGRQEILGWSSGLRLVEVPHQGNTNASPEEAREVARLAEQLTGRTWRDKNGTERSMEPTDILIITPCNAQIRAIQTTLTASGQTGFRVGTVDKFQGQEAPVVIYSMATSLADEAPRGLEFLYDPHRLNVATSRARALAIIVASPDLIRVSCRTPHQMVLANALCRAWETGG